MFPGLKDLTAGWDLLLQLQLDRRNIEHDHKIDISLCLRKPRQVEGGAQGQDEYRDILQLVMVTSCHLHGAF